MKRRGFLSSIFGLAAVPVAAKVPAATGLQHLEGKVVTVISPGSAYLPGPVTFVDADRICNPPIIVDENGEFMRLYRDEFMAGAEANHAFLRNIWADRK